jgi:hypothetical protein
MEGGISSRLPVLQLILAKDLQFTTAKDSTGLR